MLAAACASDEPVPGVEPAPVTTTTPVATTAEAAPTTITSGLDDAQRRQIFAAAAAHRLAGFRQHGPWVVTEVVDSIGAVDWDGNVYFSEDSEPFSAEDQRAIAAALAPLEVRFIRPEVLDERDVYANSEGPDGNVVLQIAEPDLGGEQPSITTAMWCGGLCGEGGASGLLRTQDGTWTITGPVGPQWVS